MYPMSGLELHGNRAPSYYTYKKLLCRCWQCKRANAEYKRAKVAANKGLTASSGYEGDLFGPSSTIPHGTPNGYDWWGCRCRECTESKVDSVRERRERLELQEVG
jgi:hypothetical protein